jgi:hypothetical protein
MGETTEDPQVTQDQHVTRDAPSTLHQQHRTATAPFDVALDGRADGATPDRGAKHLAPCVQAGLTWWIEALGWWLGTPAAALTGSGKARQCSLLVSDCHLISSTRS